MIDWLPNDILWDATTILKRVLYIVWIKIRHLKGENKLVGTGRLDSNGLEIEGSKQPIDCIRTEYSVFLKGKVYPNVGN